MKRLNRWQRTGIVLSVVWAIVGTTWGWRHAEDQITEDFKACVRAIETRSDLQACRETRFRALTVRRAYSAALVGLAPISVAWLIAYALVALVGRIRGHGVPRLEEHQFGDMPDKAPLDVVENEGSIADSSFDKDRFAAELDKLSKYEISARIKRGIWGSEQDKVAQHYLDEKVSALLTATQADARSAKNAAWVAAIFAAIAALVAVMALLK
jgi:hypothetical protein